VHRPEAIAYIREGVESHPSGRLVEEMIAGFDLSKAAAPVAQQVRVLLTSIGTLMSYTVFMFFAGIYLALDPDRYIRGLVYFTPVKNRNEVRQFIARAGTTLRTWLLTQLLVVVVNGIFAGLGLWVLGVESAIALGLLAGILSFIPYVGTIIAMVIGALAALPQGAEFALYTLVVLGIVSFVEGYFVTPYVQSRALSIPPVVLLVAMFAFTILFGASGIVLAAPLTIVLMAALDTIYVPQDEATGPVA
jgi:predicted PurR-regulated permease PerM